MSTQAPRCAKICHVESASAPEGFREGDPDAVRAVYLRYGRWVYAVAFRTLGSASLAEEAVQHTFVNAWRAAASLQPDRDMAPWLATIARNAALDIHRREARRPVLALSELDNHDRSGSVDDPSVESQFDIGAVREAIDALSDEERAVIRLAHLDGLSHAEVATRLGIPIGTVKSRSSRAHRHLARSLAHLRASDGTS